MLAALAEKIHDGRFLQLVRRMLKAGYLEDWTWHATLSGSPQGGIASPVLSYIYLDRLDQWIEPRPLPADNLGRRRSAQPGLQDRGVRDRAGEEARGPGGTAQAHPAPPPASQPGPRRPGLPAAAICPLRRRLAAGVRGPEA